VLVVDAEVTALMTDIGQMPEQGAPSRNNLNSFNWNSPSLRRIY
jgi:hypothetical protein